MRNGPKTMMSTHRPKFVRQFANRSKWGTSNIARPEFARLSKRAKKL